MIIKKNDQKQNSAIYIERKKNHSQKITQI